MKIIAISDTHGAHNHLTKELNEIYQKSPDSIIVHSGDACYEGSKYEAVEFLEWYGNLPFKTKLFIAGNHDFPFEYSLFRLDYIEMDELAKKLNIQILYNNFYNINGFKILASSHIPNLKNWAFCSDENVRERFYSNIEQDADIVISHSPPLGIGDVVQYQSVGCEYLRKYIDTNKPKIVINGHIHEGFGVKEVNGTRIFNCAILNEHYMSFNKITIIEL